MADEGVRREAPGLATGRHRENQERVDATYFTAMS